MSNYAVKCCCIFLFSVIEDDDGVSKGYGFVRFMDEAERNRCYAELDRALGLGKKPITIKPAFAPKTRFVESTLILVNASWRNSCTQSRCVLVNVHR